MDDGLRCGLLVVCRIAVLQSVQVVPARSPERGVGADRAFQVSLRQRPFFIGGRVQLLDESGGASDDLPRAAFPDDEGVDQVEFVFRAGRGDIEKRNASALFS